MSCSRAAAFSWWRWCGPCCGFATLPCCSTCRDFLHRRPISDRLGLTTTGATCSPAGRVAALDQPLAYFSLLDFGGMGDVLAVPACATGGAAADAQVRPPGPMRDPKLRRIANSKGLWLYRQSRFSPPGFDHQHELARRPGFVFHHGPGRLFRTTASFSYWNSPAIGQWLHHFVLLAGINFGTIFSPGAWAPARNVRI